MTEAYPLHWPAGFARTAPAARKRGRFAAKGDKGLMRSITIGEAVRRLTGELSMLGARYPVVSTNVRTRQDGLPYSNAREPDDPGVAVYFQLDGKPHCLPCDRYDRVADNLAAVAAHIEATRAIIRHGVGDLSRVYAGFQALPPPSSPGPDWVTVFGFGPGEVVTLDDVEQRYRELARQRHPDAGGSAEAMAELNRAREQARANLAGR